MATRIASRPPGLLTLLLLWTGCLTSVTAAADEFRMPIADVFTITGRGLVLTGQVASGSIAVGDWVCVPMQNGEHAGRQVDGLEMFRKILETVEAGQNVGVLIDGVDRKQVRKNADLTAGCAGSDSAAGAAGES